MAQPGELRDPSRPDPEADDVIGASIQRLVGRGSLYTMGTAAQLVVQVLAIPVITRLLPASDFGLAATAFIVAQLLGTLVSAGLPFAALRDYFRTSGGRVRSRALVALTLSIALVGAGVADLTGTVWVQIFSTVPYSAVMRIAVWSSVPIAVIWATSSVLRAEDRPAAFILVTLTGTAGGQVAGVLIVAVAQAGPLGYVGGVALGQLVAAMGGLALVPPAFGGIPSLGIRRTFRFALPMVPHQLGVVVLNLGDRLVIERVAGLTQVGQYQVAYAVAAVGVAVLKSVNVGWQPIIHAQPKGRRWDVLKVTRSEVLTLLGIIASGIAIGAPLALTIAAPADYDPLSLVPVTAIVVASVLPLAAQVASSTALMDVGETSILAWASALAGAVNIGLNLLLIPVLGLEGAAIATVLSYSLQATLVGHASRRATGMRSSLQVDRPVWLLSTILIGVGIAIPPSGVWFIARVVLATGMFVFLVHRMWRLYRSGRTRTEDPVAGRE